MQTIKNIIFTNPRYVVRFAQNEEDLRAAQRLRYNVFNVELGEGLEDSQELELDADQFDMQCHHLLVISKKTEEVIGTYRMQTYRMAQKSNGFYTAGEFDLSPISQEVLDNSIEVGRACIAPEHRNGRVLYLLWRGLAQYLMEFEKRYLFGCCSLTSQSAQEAWNVMEYLRQNSYLHGQYLVEANDSYICERKEPDAAEAEAVSLPKLFRLYMDIGARVCSVPAMDRSFKTIDYLVLLDVENLDSHTRILFFK